MEIITILFYIVFSVLFFMGLLMITQYVSEYWFFKTICRMQNGKFVIMWIDKDGKKYVSSIRKSGVSALSNINEDTLIFYSFEEAVVAIESCELREKFAIVSLKDFKSL